MGLLDSAADSSIVQGVGSSLSSQGGISPVAQSAISAGSGVLGGLIGAFQTGSINHQAFRHEVDMYNVQRKDALADRDYANQYNSPAAQMQRLQSAGLNPNLVYGNGNAVQTSAPVRASQMSAPHLDVPQFGSAAAGAIQGGLATYQDVQLKQAQTNLLKANVETAMKEQGLKDAQRLLTLANIPNVNVSTDTKDFNLGLNKSLMDNTMEYAAAKTQNLVASTNVMLNANERAAAMNSVNLLEGMQKVGYLRAQTAQSEAQRQQILQATENLKTNNDINQLNLKLKSKGFNWTDPYWIRVGSTIIDKYLPQIDKALGNILSPGDNKSAGENVQDYIDNLMYH